MPVERVKPLLSLREKFYRDLKNDRQLKLILNLLFDQEKRLLILEGKPPVPRGQYINALKAQF